MKSSRPYGRWLQAAIVELLGIAAILALLQWAPGRPHSNPSAEVDVTAAERLANGPLATISHRLTNHFELPAWRRPDR